MWPIASCGLLSEDMNGLVLTRWKWRPTDRKVLLMEYAAQEKRVKPIDPRQVSDSVEALE